MFKDALYEKIWFKDYKFPLRYVRRQINSPCVYCDSLTWHDEIEIKIFRQGSARLLIENSPVEAVAGDIVVINPYETHQNLEFFQPTQYDMFIINLGFLQNSARDNSNKDVFLSLLNGSVKINRLIRGDKRISQISELLADEFKDSAPERETLLISLFLYFLSVLTESQLSESPSPRSVKRMSDLKRLEPVIKHIKQNLDKDLSLDTLADISGFSPKYLSRLFKNTAFINLNSYINQLRLNSAQLLIATSDKKFKDIAQELGFLYESYFMRWFKKHTGITPSQYRAKTPE